MTRFKARSIGQSGLDEQHADLSSDQVLARPPACESLQKRPKADSARIACTRAAKDLLASGSLNGRAAAAVRHRDRGTSAAAPGGRRDLTVIEERLHDVMSLVSDWIWETDDALRLTYASFRVTEALGYDPAELVGCLLSELAVDPDALRAIFGDQCSARPFRDREIQLKNRAGEARNFRISAVPVVSPKGRNLIGFRGTAQDITELSAREAALREAVEAAAAANRIRSEFLANTSHELRTPLNAIIGFTEIMHAGHFGPIGCARYRDYLENVLESARHLLSLIDDVLDVAETEAGEIELEEAPIDPAEAVRQALCQFSVPAARAGVAIQENVPPLPKILADGRKIRQVLLNLLSNAIKYTPEGGTVELSAHLADSGEFVLRVTDSGIGIADEDHESVLAPFGQADSRQRGKLQGTGLGLPLCDALTRLHGGRLDLQSVAGEGTVVTVTLPAHRVVRELGTTREERNCPA